LRNQNKNKMNKIFFKKQHKELTIVGITFRKDIWKNESSKAMVNASAAATTSQERNSGGSRT
jgi:hypothetical protein